MSSIGWERGRKGTGIHSTAFAEQRSHYIFSKRREELNQGGSRAESARTPSVLRFVLFSPRIPAPLSSSAQTLGTHCPT